MPQIYTDRTDKYQFPPAAIAFGHGFPTRVHKNNAHFVSDFCDFSRAVVKPCHSSTY